MIAKRNCRSSLIYVCMIAVAAIGMGVPAWATPMYSITSLGTANYPGLSATTDPTDYKPLTISSSGSVASYNPGGVSGWGPEFTAGAYGASDEPSGAYLQIGAQQQLIMPPGANSSSVLGVSSVGDMVGYSNSKSMPNFVYSYANKSFLSLNLGSLQPEGPQSGGGYYSLSAVSPFTYYGINAQNQLVGSYVYGDQGKWTQIDHAFIASLTPGSLGYGGLDLNSLLPPNAGWILTSATGINDAGQIVGWGIDPLGVYSAYELTPLANETPEPSTLAIFAVAGIGFAVRKLVCRARRER